MTVLHPDIRKKLKEWEAELRKLTGNDVVLLIAFHPPGISMEAKELSRIIVEETGVPMHQIRSQGRKREVVVARQLIAYYCSQYTDLTLKEIGTMIGDKDHTTVIHSKRRVLGLIQAGDRYVCTAIEKINKRLENAVQR